MSDAGQPDTDCQRWEAGVCVLVRQSSQAACKHTDSSKGLVVFRAFRTGDRHMQKQAATSRRARCDRRRTRAVGGGRGARAGSCEAGRAVEARSP